MSAQKKVVTLPPKDAYGEVDPELVMCIPIEKAHEVCMIPSTARCAFFCVCCVLVGRWTLKLVMLIRIEKAHGCAFVAVPPVSYMPTIHLCIHNACAHVAVPTLSRAF